VISEVKSLKPDVKISADIWPEYDETIVDIYQDPKTWVRNDYINNLIPMSYYLNEAPVVDDIMNSLEFTRGYSQITSGIASLNKVDAKVLLKQVNAIRASNTKGISIFEFESIFNGRYNEVLEPGAFSTPAAVTGRNPGQSVNLLINEIIRKIDDIYVRNSAITEDQAAEYKKLLLEIKVEGVNDITNAKEAYSLKNSIEEVINKCNVDEGLNKEVANRILYDLNSAINIIDGYISENRFLTEHKVRNFQMELPLSTIESSNEIPFRVKAVFDDNAVMYLDKSQYRIKASNTAAVEIAEDKLIIKDKKEKSLITIEILDSFNFNTINSTVGKAEVVLNQKDKVLWDPAYGILKVPEVSFTTVKLDWGSTIADSEISGYIVYCNDKELTRTPSSIYTHNDLQPDDTYTYHVEGFDAAGSIVYESSKVTVITKAFPLLAK
jgi:hypothetical protein